MRTVDRREFLKTAALFGAGAALGPIGAGAAAAEGPLVVSVKGQGPGRIAREAVRALGGMQAFVGKGETVVVKPNIGWDRRPDQAANTHPEVVREVVLMCLEAGAARVKVFDRTCNDPRRCYATSGIAAAVEGIGDRRVELSHVDERRFRQVEIPGALALPKCSFYEDVLEAQKLINLPIAKHHSAAVLTMGLKNILGVTGGNRAVLHRILPEALVDLNRAVRSHLTLVDATRVLTANGPQGGRLEDVKVLDTVLASTDVVAADAVACGLFQKSPKDVRYLQLAQEKGLGVADLARVRVRALTV